MPDFNRFTNDFPVNANTKILGSDVDTDVIVYTDPDGWLTITYTGTDSSQWFSFEIGATSDVILLGLLDRSTGVVRLNDNFPGAVVSTTYWINDNITTPPNNTWQNDQINVYGCIIKIIQNTPTDPDTRVYVLKGNGNQSSAPLLQPPDVFVQAYRII